MKNVVGQRIRELRYRGGRKVSQEELAARVQAMGVNIDQTAISRIKNGERDLLDYEIIAISRALGFSVEDLFEGAELPEN